MKKNIYILLLAVIALSCSKENHHTNKEVNFKFNIATQTRATDSEFEIGDKVGLFNYKNEEFLYSNILYSYTSSGFYSFEPIFYELSEPVNFVAYYPYSESLIWDLNDSLSWNVAQFQWEDKNYSNSDLMVAKNLMVTPSADSEIEMNFNHIMSKIELIFIPGTGKTATDLLESEINVFIKETSRSCNVGTKELGIGARSNIGDIETTPMSAISNNTVVGAQAIIIPQVIEAGKTLIEVMVDGQKYVYKPSEQLEFKQGKKIVFKLTINERNIVFASEIQDWKDGETITGEGNVFVEEKVKDYDGNEYSIVVIGEQSWLSENIKSLHLNDGTSIVKGSMFDFMRGGTFYTTSQAANQENVLYSKNVVNTGKICPEGWRVPTSVDMTALINYLSKTEAGLMTKSTQFWSDGSSEKETYQGDGTTALNILPTGFADKNSYGAIKDANTKAHIWVQDSMGSSYSYSYTWAYNSKAITSNYRVETSNCLGIRCIKETN